MKHKLIGIDLAKNVFQVCAVNQAGKLVFNHKVGRARLAEVMTSQDPTQVAMEACASAHCWGWCQGNMERAARSSSTA